MFPAAAPASTAGGAPEIISLDSSPERGGRSSTVPSLPPTPGAASEGSTTTIFDEMIKRDAPANFSALPEAWLRPKVVDREATWMRHALSLSDHGAVHV